MKNRTIKGNQNHYIKFRIGTKNCDFNKTLLQTYMKNPLLVVTTTFIHSIHYEFFNLFRISYEHPA